MKPIALFVVALFCAGGASASPCTEKIAALQERAGAMKPTDAPNAAADPTLPGTAPQTTAAQLHHQPTEGSVANAERRADSSFSERQAHYQVMIEQARAAADSGDEATCESSVREAEKALGPR